MMIFITTAFEKLVSPRSSMHIWESHTMVQVKTWLNTFVTSRIPCVRLNGFNVGSSGSITYD